MIIYGYREATLQAETFEGAVCPHCGQQGHVACAVYSRHVHIMFIPLFPFYKRMDIWCQHCGEQSHNLDYPVEIQAQMRDFKRSQKPRIWQFFGIILFVVFVISLFFNARKETARTKELFENPALDDVYCVQFDNECSLMAIAEIQRDSIYFYHNEYFTSKKSNVKKLHRADFYEQGTVYGFSKDELQEMYDDKTILKIWRDLPYSTEKIKVDQTDINENLYEELESKDKSMIEEEDPQITE